MKVRVSKRAQGQIERAAHWWDEHRDLAPQAFDEDIAKAFLLLGAEPLIGAPFPSRSVRGSCRVLAHEPGYRSLALTSSHDAQPYGQPDAPAHGLIFGPHLVGAPVTFNVRRQIPWRAYNL